MGKAELARSANFAPEGWTPDSPTSAKKKHSFSPQSPPHSSPASQVQYIEAAEGVVCTNAKNKAWERVLE